MTAQKQKALYDATVLIRRILSTKKPFMDFDYIYGSGALFGQLTREEVEELYNEMK